MLTVPRKLLITDDDANLRETLKMVFEPVGLDLYTAQDGLETLEIVASNDIDCLLMDVHMPRLGGLEALRLLHSRTKRQIPCILMSAQFDEEIVKAAEAAQVFDMLPKPLNLCKLRNLVLRAIGVA